MGVHRNQAMLCNLSNSNIEDTLFSHCQHRQWSWPMSEEASLSGASTGSLENNHV